MNILSGYDNFSKKNAYFLGREIAGIQVAQSSIGEVESE
jgi:hypothetical protein